MHSPATLATIAVGIELDGDADERHQHDGVGPEKEGVLDRVQKAPLRVGEPVFPVEARAAVEPDHGGYAADELFVEALRHAEGRHHRVGPALYRGFDHRPRIFQSLDGAVGARVVHRRDQRLSISSKYRCSSHLHPWSGAR
jgi:hypothetical protein